MNKKPTAILVCVLLMVFPLHASSKGVDNKKSNSYEFYTLGFGGTACDEYLENSRKEGFEGAMKAWLSGYYSSLNFMIRKNRIFFDWDDIDNTIIEVNQYCGAQVEPGTSAVIDAVNHYWQENLSKKEEKLQQKK